jgi:hypothetical protein
MIANDTKLRCPLIALHARRGTQPTGNRIVRWERATTAAALSVKAIEALQSGLAKWLRVRSRFAETIVSADGRGASGSYAGYIGGRVGAW